MDRRFCFKRAVTGVSLNFANWSESDPVYLRIAISNLANPQQSGGTWWASSAPIYFAPESGWGTASFQINESSMQRVGNLTGELGLDTFDDTLSDINGFRILSSTLGYGAIGDEFYGVVGMDNIQLITIPEPSFIASLFTILVLTCFLKGTVDSYFVNLECFMLSSFLFNFLKLSASF